jgi:rSAM/selenodomain-associated transferase 1
MIEAALMLKVPRPGYCKTRLAATIGAEAACAIYSALVHWQISQIPFDWRVSVHFAPADAEVEARAWLSPWSARNLSFSPQEPGDLGARMLGAVRQGLQSSHSVVLMGGDCPGLTTHVLTEVSQLLAGRNHPVVIPATDGGYVLLGISEVAPTLFQGIPWSTAQVFAITMERAMAASLKPIVLEPLEDIDDEGSLKNHRIRIRQLLEDSGVSDKVLGAIVEKTHETSSVVDATN